MGAALLGTAVVAGAVAWLAVDYTSTPRLGATTPNDNGWVRQSQPQITMHVDNASNLKSYTVDLDGANVTNQVQRSGDQLTVGRRCARRWAAHGHALGRPRAACSAASIARTFTFTVDTQAPKLALSQRPQRLRRQHNLRSPAERSRAPGSRIAAGSTTIDARASRGRLLPRRSTSRTAPTQLSITAIDPGGQHPRHHGELRVDATAARGDAPRAAQAAPHPADDPRLADGHLNGDHEADARRPAVQARHASLGAAGAGRALLRVQATDAAGNVTVKHARILVNTSEKLGDQRADRRAPWARTSSSSSTLWSPTSC